MGAAMIIQVPRECDVYFERQSVCRRAVVSREFDFPCSVVGSLNTSLHYKTQTDNTSRRKPQLYYVAVHRSASHNQTQCSPQSLKRTLIKQSLIISLLRYPHT